MSGLRFWEEDEGGIILWIGGVADRSIRANGSDRSYIHSQKKAQTFMQSEEGLDSARPGPSTISFQSARSRQWPSKQ
jgi:hypothetical protein